MVGAANGLFPKDISAIAPENIQKEENTYKARLISEDEKT